VTPVLGEDQLLPARINFLLFRTYRAQIRELDPRQGIRLARINFASFRAYRAQIVELDPRQGKLILADMGTVTASPAL
jgi:hypothetical protein